MLGIKKQQEGASMIEYTFIALLVLLVCIAGVQFMGQEIAALFTDEDLQEALTSPDDGGEPPEDPPPPE